MEVEPPIEALKLKPLSRIHLSPFSENKEIKLIKHFQDRKVLGEYVLIIEGNENPFEREPKALVEELQERFDLSAKDALVAAAKLLNRPKRELYDSLHRNDS